jgi:hypothetical protein
MMGAGDAQRGMYVSPADRTDAEWARFQRVSCVSGSLSLSLSLSVSLSLSLSLSLCVCVRPICGRSTVAPRTYRMWIHSGSPTWTTRNDLHTHTQLQLRCAGVRPVPMA